MNNNFAKIVTTWQVENLIGKIMLTIETMGLDKTQLEASKSLIKQFIWSVYNEGISVSEDEVKAKEDAQYKVKNNITQ